MSRARNIKPGFFKNDLLAECHPLARILFAGLWCEADRSGRLEERPKRLKADLLPYDDCDIDELLGQLESRGFIVRYESGGVRFIAVPQFGKHQNPHKKEAASTIPAPVEHSSSTVQEQGEDGSGSDEAYFSDSGGTDEHSSSRADSLSLDSPFLIPDSNKSVSVGAGAEADEAGEPPAPAAPETPVNVLATKAMIAAGIPAHRCNAGNADMADLIAAGRDAEFFRRAAAQAVGAGNPDFAYAIGIAKKRHAKEQAEGSAVVAGFRKPSVTDSFENRRYDQTPDDLLPLELRDAAHVA